MWGRILGGISRLVGGFAHAYRNATGTTLSRDQAFDSMTQECAAWLHHGMAITTTTFTIALAVATAVIGLAAVFAKDAQARHSLSRALYDMPYLAKVAGLGMIVVGIIVVPILGEFCLVRCARRYDIARRRRDAVLDDSDIRSLPGMPIAEHMDAKVWCNQVAHGITALILLSSFAWAGFIYWYRVTFVRIPWYRLTDLPAAFAVLAIAFLFGWNQFVIIYRTLVRHKLEVGDGTAAEYAWVGHRPISRYFSKSFWLSEVWHPRRRMDYNHPDQIGVTRTRYMFGLYFALLMICTFVWRPYLVWVGKVPPRAEWAIPEEVPVLTQQKSSIPIVIWQEGESVRLSPTKIRIRSTTKSEEQMDVLVVASCLVWEMPSELREGFEFRIVTRGSQDWIPIRRPRPGYIWHIELQGSEGDSSIPDDIEE